MLNIKNHKLAELHFNHVLKSTGQILPIMIKPVCPERDLEAKKAVIASNKEVPVTNNCLTEQAASELKFSYIDHFDDDYTLLYYSWAICDAKQTLGFMEYQLQSLRYTEYNNWPLNVKKPSNNVLHRSIYLIPNMQGEGIGSVACAVISDFLFNKSVIKPEGILAEKFSDNVASLALTTTQEGWQHAISHIGQTKTKETFILLKENYKPSAKLTPYELVLPASSVSNTEMFCY